MNICNQTCLHSAQGRWQYNVFPVGLTNHDIWDILGVPLELLHLWGPLVEPMLSRKVMSYLDDTQRFSIQDPFITDTCMLPCAPEVQTQLTHTACVQELKVELHKYYAMAGEMPTPQCLFKRLLNKQLP